MVKGRGLSKSLESSLKKDFDAYVRAPGLARAEAEQRRTQLDLFMRSFKTAVEAYTEAANAAVAGMRRHPVPSKAAEERSADSRDRKRADEEDSRLCVAGRTGAQGGHARAMGGWGLARWAAALAV